MIKKCLSCGKGFKTYPCRVGKFCSYSCNNKMKPGTFRKGHNGLKGEAHGNWKGGVIRNSCGYIWVYSPSHPFKDIRGYVLQHRLIVEKRIKRYLAPTEVVHHINRKRSDNRSLNLRLYKNQSNHMKYGHKK